MDDLGVTSENMMNNSEEEMEEVEVWEFSLDGEDIDDLIEELRKLKETKTSFGFDIDESNELLIHYEDVENTLEGTSKNE